MDCRDVGPKASLVMEIAFLDCHITHLDSPGLTSTHLNSAGHETQRRTSEDFRGQFDPLHENAILCKLQKPHKHVSAQTNASSNRSLEGEGEEAEERQA